LRETIETDVAERLEKTCVALYIDCRAGVNAEYYNLALERCAEAQFNSYGRVMQCPLHWILQSAGMEHISEGHAKYVVMPKELDKEKVRESIGKYMETVLAKLKA
jgi:hypothetical protein